MASPPLSPEERLRRAQYVYVGTVARVRDGEADLAVEAVEKSGLSARGAAGETVVLHFRRPEAQPLGWTGDAGQHSPLPPGGRIRAFVSYDGENRAQLLEPNGWEPA